MSALNNIVVTQNDETHLKLLRARQQTYNAATYVMVFQLLGTLGIPIGGGLSVLLHPEMKPHIVAASLILTMLDALLLDRHQKALIKRAAKIAEQFDCAVLGLPWNQFSVGDKLEAEDIHAAARAYSRRRGDGKLRNWYPIAVDGVPLHLARIICQRTNLRYDSKLRRSYGNILISLSVLIIIALISIGLAQNTSFTGWILTLTLATPFLAWGAREYYRQIDTADLLDSLTKEARKLWSRALADECGTNECDVKSREFQDAIYNRRATSPLVVPLLYRIRRLSLEDEMNAGADDWLKQYELRKKSSDT